MPKLRRPSNKPTTEALQRDMIVFPRINEEDCVVLAVDPGDEHVGMALGCRYFSSDGEQYTLHAPGWRVYDTAEMTPDAFVSWFRQYKDMIDILALEKFILFPQLAKEQTGSEMQTSKLIGWLEWYVKYDAPHIEILEATSQVLQAPIPALLARIGVEWVSPPGPNISRGSTGDHQRSAETHWWHRLIKAGLVDGLTLAQ